MKVNNIIIIDTTTFNLAKKDFGGIPQGVKLDNGVDTKEIMLCREPNGFDLERVWIASNESAFESPEIINKYIESKRLYQITEINIHTRVIEKCGGKDDTRYKNVIESLLEANENVLRVEILSAGEARSLPDEEGKVITALQRSEHQKYMRHSRWQECTAEHENRCDGAPMTAKEHAVCKDFDMRNFFKKLIGIHIELLDYWLQKCDSKTEEATPEAYTKFVIYLRGFISDYQSGLENTQYWEIVKKQFDWCKECKDNISASDFCKKYEELVKISCDLMRRSETNNNE